MLNHNPNIEFISHSNIEHIARRKETVGFCVPFSMRLYEKVDISTPLSWSLTTISVCFICFWFRKFLIFCPMQMSFTCIIRSMLFSFFIYNENSFQKINMYLKSCTLLIENSLGCWKHVISVNLFYWKFYKINLHENAIRCILEK